MKAALPVHKVKQWLRGQKVAMKRIEKERLRLLRQLTTQQSARIYLSLNSQPISREHPSPLLSNMRKVLKRCAELLASRSA